jgi:small subunit ribosomal protein S1
MNDVELKDTARSAPGLPGEPVPVSAEEAAAFEEEFDLDALMEEWEQHKARDPVSPTEGILQGTVVSVREDGLFVDVGRKSEAFLPIEAARGRGSAGDEPELAVGDSIAVSITGRSPDGYLTLSRIVVERPRDWSQFEAAFRDSVTVAGTVKEVIKGGLHVDVGARAFMPASRTGVREAADLEKLVGQEIRCRIIQLDVEDENIVVDRRVILEEERDQERQSTIAGLQPDMVVRAVVRNLRDFGAFVDLGGVDGLLHVSDIAWARVKDPASVLSEGQELDVKILKVEKGGERISVGLKQLTPDPWTLIGEKLHVGERVHGTVTRLKDFGAFVEIEPGIEGLIHVSEMSWARKVRHPQDLLKVGDEVEAVVLEMKTGERRIGLGLKQALGDPWERAEKELAPGSVVEGTVRNIAKFGAFIEVLEGVEGLVHVSDITAEKRLDHPSEMLKLDQKVKAVVLELDREKRRLKLGMKQLEPDDRDEFIASCEVGDTVTGRVVRVKKDQAVVELGEGVKAVCLLQDAPAPAASAEQRTSQEASASSLGAMLQAAWKSGDKGAAAAATIEPLKSGEVRSFRVTKLDVSRKLIELALA